MLTLAGFENQGCRQRASRVATADGVGRLLCGAIALALAVGCSDLDPGNESYCDVNAGIGTCGTGGRAGTVDEGWWCLDQDPEPLRMPRPQLVGFALPAVEWGTLAPLAGMGLVANLCPITDFSCASPLNRETGPIPVMGTLGGVDLGLGVGGIPVPEGFTGFIKFDVQTPPNTPEAQQFISDSYYLGGTISGDMTVGAPILMFQKGVRQSIIQQSFPGVNAAESQNLGVLAFGVYDCDGRTVSDARIEINVAGRTPADAIPFQLPNSRIPIAKLPGEDLYTGTSGLGGYLNVPVGSVQLTAYRRNDPQVIGRVELGSVAGQLSIAPIRPSYVLDADVSGAPALEPAVPIGG